MQLASLKTWHVFSLTSESEARLKGLSEQQSSRQSSTANLSLHSSSHFIILLRNMFIFASAETAQDSHAFGDRWDFTGWAHTFILLGMWSIPICLFAYLMADNIGLSQVQYPYGQ